MQRILVVCGAGASSTFLALRLRRLAAAEGHEFTFAASAQDAVPACLAETDLLLVGPHLSNSFDELAQAARSFDAQAALLAEDVFSADDGAARALAKVVSLLASRSPESSPPLEPKETS